MAVRSLHVIDSLAPGGAERSLVDLVLGLRDHGFDPTVVCLARARQGLEPELVDTGVAVRHLSATSRIARIAELRRVIHEIDPDLVHTSLFESDVAARLAIRRAVPTVTSVVNTSYDPVRLHDPNVTHLRLRAAQAVDALTARLFTGRFHAISCTVRDAAVRDLRIPAGRVTVVPRGRDPDRLGRVAAERRAAVRRALGVPLDVPLLVNVGRHEFQKGQRHLLDAASTVATTCPDAVWLVAGRYGNASDGLMARRAQLGLEDRVRILGHRDDVPDLLAAADVFVLPSLFEGLGGAVIEAMALGVPVVASDLPAIREVTGDGRAGTLIPPADGIALADRVLAVLSDDELRSRLGQAGRRRFERHYTVDRMVDGMVELFHTTVAEHTGRYQRGTGS